MSKRLVVKKSGNATLVLSNGELQWDYVTNRLRVHDGYTAGGRSSIQMYSSGFSYVFPTPVSSTPEIKWDGAVTETILQADSLESNAYFGSWAAMSGDGDYVAIGAYGQGSYGNAYIFNYSGSSWSQQAKLQQSDTGTGDAFGKRLDISKDALYVIVGNSEDETETSGFNYTNLDYGAAYIFLRTGTSWAQQAKLTPSDRAQQDKFGSSVSISDDGTYALAGAYKKYVGSDTYVGAAYIFLRTGTSWAQQAKITASDAQAADQFGWSSAISGDGLYAIVGAIGEDTGGSNSGAAYIYLRTGTSWAQQAKIQAGGSGANFGYSVDISGDGQYAVIGATQAESTAGAAYVYLRTGTSWALQSTLTASDGVSSDQLGLAVAISHDGNFVTVTTRLEDGGTGDPLSNAGAAYVFERDDTTWTEVKKITASDAQANDQFGAYGVSMNEDGSKMVTGAWQEDGGSGDPNSAAGAAYIYEV